MTLLQRDRVHCCTSRVFHADCGAVDQLFILTQLPEVSGVCASRSFTGCSDRKQWVTSGEERVGNPLWCISLSQWRMWVVITRTEIQGTTIGDYPCPQVLDTLQYSSVKQILVIWGVCHLHFVVLNSWLLVMLLWSTLVVVVLVCHRHKGNFWKDNKLN